jgi:hypothetical protein
MLDETSTLVGFILGGVIFTLASMIYPQDFLRFTAIASFLIAGILVYRRYR